MGCMTEVKGTNYAHNPNVMTDDYKAKLKKALLRSSYLVRGGQIKQLDQFCTKFIGQFVLGTKFIEDKFGKTLIQGQKDFIVKAARLEAFCSESGIDLSELMGRGIVLIYPYELYRMDRKRRRELMYLARTQKFLAVERVPWKKSTKC